MADNVTLLSASIAGLFEACRPSAISRSVWTVVVYAVNAVIAGWALAHVRVEQLKGMAPAVAHGNTAASVISPHLGARVRAAADYTTPSLIFPTGAAAGCMAMLDTGGRRPLFLQTATTAMLPLRQITAACRDDSTTGAFAAPCRFLAQQSVSMQYGESVEHSGRQVYEASHLPIIPEEVRLSAIGR